MLQACHRILERQGYHVETERDAVQGRERALRDHFDLILVDMRMPEVDGLDLLADDPGQLQEVVTSLVLNAIDAMEESGVLTVETLAGPNPPEVCIRISDTGRGIPPEAMPFIFEPFFTTKKVGQGTGLGLAIGHGIVTRAGGRVEVSSSPGGATFTVRLPVSRVEAGDGAAEAAGRFRRRPYRSAGPSRSVRGLRPCGARRRGFEPGERWGRRGLRRRSSP